MFEVSGRIRLVVHIEDDVHLREFVWGHEMGIVIIPRVQVECGKEVINGSCFFRLVIHAETQDNPFGFGGLHDFSNQHGFGRSDS